MTEAPTEPILFRKACEESAPIDGNSLALFRLGEQCNNHCLMCANPVWDQPLRLSRHDLLQRLAFLYRNGIRQVILTGGEPTCHRHFWMLVQQIGKLGVVWDINTNGRNFHDPSYCRRTVDAGLRRAIVSLHSHRTEIAEFISQAPGAYRRTVDGITNLLDAKVELLINCVLTTANRAELTDYVTWCAATFGRSGYGIKFSFPSTLGRGGGSDLIQLRYSEIRETLNAARSTAAQIGLNVCVESVPNCILGDPDLINIGRSGFGETHYLDDLSGCQLHSMRYLDALFNLYGEVCRDCAVASRCPGVPADYIDRCGLSEIAAFTKD